MASKKKNKDKLRKERMRKEQLRRQKQSEASKPRMQRPSDIVEGITNDILNLLSAKATMGVHIKERLKSAEALKEKFPTKFAELNVDEFESLQTRYNDISAAIDDLVSMTGKIVDLEAMSDKLALVSSNVTNLASVQFDFDRLGDELTSVDRRFVERFAKLNQGAVVEFPEATPEEGQPEVTFDQIEENRTEPVEIPLTDEEAAQIIADQTVTLEDQNGEPIQVTLSN